MATAIDNGARDSMQTASRSGTREALLFRVGQRVLAIPIDEISQILPLSTSEKSAVVCSDKPFEVEVDGMPVPYYPLWKLLSETPAYQEFADLAVALKQRKQDHISWMANLADSIQREDVPFTKARSPYECAFGKWYYGYQTENRRLKRILREFEAPHCRIHSLAERLLDMKTSGHREEALRLLREEESTTLAALLKLFDGAINLLDKLQQYLTVIVHYQRMRYALGIDAVIGLAELQETSPAEIDGYLAAFRLPILGFMKQAEGRLVPILDWRRLITS